LIQWGVVRILPEQSDLAGAGDGVSARAGARIAGGKEMSRHRTGQAARRPAMPEGDVVRGPEGTLRSRATAAAKRTFLATLAETGSVVAGAVAARRSKWAVYEWRKRDPVFARRWEDALTVALAAIETEAYRRAVLGCEVPVVSGGKIVTTVRRYSDHLLGLLLRMHAPERYAVSRAEVALGVAGAAKAPTRFTFRIGNVPPGVAARDHGPEIDGAEGEGDEGDGADCGGGEGAEGTA
jgi:hypothetical protein